MFHGHIQTLFYSRPQIFLFHIANKKMDHLFWLMTRLTVIRLRQMKKLHKTKSERFQVTFKPRLMQDTLTFFTFFGTLTSRQGLWAKELHKNKNEPFQVTMKPCFIQDPLIPNLFLVNIFWDFYTKSTPILTFDFGRGMGKYQTLQNFYHFNL